MERTKKEYKDVSFEDMFAEERKRTNFINNSIISQLNYYNNQSSDSSLSKFSNTTNNISVTNSSSNSSSRYNNDYITDEENKKYNEEYRVLTSITTEQNAQVMQFFDNIYNNNNIYNYIMNLFESILIFNIIFL